MRRSIPLALVSLVVVACTSVPEGAKEYFSDKNTCPLDQVQVRARAELKPHDVMHSKPDKAPPRDIAADPARLAMWQQKQDEAAQLDNAFCDVYEASGCGKTQLLCCKRSNGKQATAKPVFCTEGHDPAVK